MGLKNIPVCQRKIFKFSYLHVFFPELNDLCYWGNLDQCTGFIQLLHALLLPPPTVLGSQTAIMVQNIKRLIFPRRTWV